MDYIKKISFIVVIISICALVSNTIIYLNYVKQQVVIQDIERHPPTLLSKKINEFDLNYPNINIYVVPFKTYIGRLYLRDSLYEKAIESFHKGRKNNPYLMINENYLADLYKEINLKDSFNYYTSLAFKNMPNHPAHFGRYIEMLGEKKNSYIVDSIFNSLIHKTELMWKIYLSSLTVIEEKSDLAINNFQLARNLFPRNQAIELSIDYNTYGIEKIEKAKTYENVSDALAEKDKFDEALELIDKAILLHPYNKYYEKAATLSYKLKLFNKSLEYLEKIDLGRFYDKGRYHLIKGVSLAKLNDFDQACKELTKSIFNKNNEAIKAKRVFCK